MSHRYREVDPTSNLLFAENTPDGVAEHECVLDDQGRPVDYVFVYINAAFERLTGLRCEDVLGKRVTEVLPGIRQTGFDWIAEYGRVALTGQSIRFEQCSEMLGRWYDIQAFSTKRGRFTTIFADITERKAIEAALRDSEERLRALVDGLPDVVMRFDTERRHTFVSDNVSEVVKLRPEEFIGKTHLEMGFPKETCAIWENAIQRVLDSGVADATEFSIEGADGPVVYDWRLIPEFDDRGEVRSVLTVSRDITESKRAEAALRDSAQRLEAFLHLSQVIAGASEPDSLMQVIVDSAARATNVDSGAIYLSADNESIRLAATTPALPADFPDQFRLAHLEPHAHIRRAMTSGEHVLMEDSATATLTPAEQEIVQIRNLRTSLYLPISLRGETMGILILSSVGEVHEFAEEDIRLLQGFANHAAQVIDRVHSHQQTKEYALTLEQRVTELKQAQEALTKSEERLKTFLTQSPAIVYSYEIHEGAPKVTYVSPNVRGVLGYGDAGEFIDNHAFWHERLHPGDAHAVAESLVKLLAVGEVSLEYRFADANGSYRWLHDKQRLLTLEDGTPVVIGTWWDITEQRQAADRLRDMSYSDSLTGIANRRFLEAEMNRLHAAGELPLSIIMADVDGLKVVNDAYGHKRGDEVLQKAALILRQACRQEDAVGRWGGDEFIIILPKTSEAQARRVCRRITASGTSIGDVPISLSAGVATGTRRSQTVESLLKAAEDDLYRQKTTAARSHRHAVLDGLLKTLAMKSFETEKHVHNMQRTALAIGRAIDLHESELARLKLVIALHDIGKITVPDEILAKRGPLTAGEWQIMKQHPATGRRIALAMGEFAHVAEDILAHHERWDGSGYP